MIQQQQKTYTDGDITMHGQFIRDDQQTAPLPGVLIAPSFRGLSDFEIEQGKALAALGYAVLVVDYYGDGRLTTSPEEATAWKNELDNNRPVFCRRMLAALNALRAMDGVDAQRTGAMGYCFGGKGVLDLARSGESFSAAVSLHGVYDAPSDAKPEDLPRIQPAVLILHGYDDPLSPPESVERLSQELTARCSDWQILTFGHTGHSYTNPKAQNPGFTYQPVSNQRSWRVLTEFFADVF
ncbi:Dienelactone hydrolase family protein [Vibrio aerogenes CECT 7868]|uniref:Dienelactone hydrolase family protein n=1 Tax=Vibrio aerogenes CECT 7868 TaxID=1216006 RepID=A0A1M5ZRC9_9VIBR|nr:dienelactone hydrolase family protein [Vibrio aerogenes]SHI26905.1 Dienelactone hydrolase family protein [Vibrio aerogenes CECT 7868]